MKKHDELPDGERAAPNDDITTKELMRMMLDLRQGDQQLARDQQQIQREQLKQTKPPSNKRGPDASVFNPRGQKDFPMPPLAFDVLAPWPSSKGNYHPFTSEEVQLLNRVKLGECLLDLNDESQVRCNIIGTVNTSTGKTERIAFMGPRDPDSNSYQTLFSKERWRSFYSMTRILHQVLDQQKTDYSDIMTMKEIDTRMHLPETDPDFLSVSVGE